MSDFFTLFQPGLVHWKRWRDAEKVLFLDARKGGTGRQPLDLDSGTVTIELPSTRLTGEPAGAGEAPPA